MPEVEGGGSGTLRRRGSFLAAGEGNCLGGGSGGGGEAGLSTELLDTLKSLRNLGSFQTYKIHNSTH